MTSSISYTLVLFSGWLWDLHHKYSQNWPKGSRWAITTGFSIYHVLHSRLGLPWLLDCHIHCKICMQSEERVDSLLCCTVGLVWLPGWYFNKMQDYKNKEWTEFAKILRTDTSEIKTFMIDMKSVAVITEEFCILYCVIL